MSPENITQAQQDLKGRCLFETLYVAKGEGHRTVYATYCITDRKDDDPGVELFAHTVDLRTGLTVRMFCDPSLTKSPARDALEIHYSPEYVRTDGLVLMQELCADYQFYAPGAFEAHPVYGAAIYYSDVDELHAGDDESDTVFLLR